MLLLSVYFDLHRITWEKSIFLNIVFLFTLSNITLYCIGPAKGRSNKILCLIVCLSVCLKFFFWTAHRKFQIFFMKLVIWCKKWQQDFFKKIILLSFGAKRAQKEAKMTLKKVIHLKTDILNFSDIFLIKLQ